MDGPRVGVEELEAAKCCGGRRWLTNAPVDFGTGRHATSHCEHTEECGQSKPRKVAKKAKGRQEVKR